MKLLMRSWRLGLATKWICKSCERRHAFRSLHQLRKLPNAPARTRFAPSPTGYLHLGSLRTALFNYLLAKATGGQFLLRIEDTDQKRTVPGAEDRLFQDLDWAGLQWDEGPKVGGPYGPYKQSQRTALYREHAEKLLQSGNAYRCFCTPERLNALAKQRSELGLPTDYDRTCTHVSTEESEDRAAKGEAHVVRLKVPDKYPEFNDMVYGSVRRRRDKKPLALANPAYEDIVLLKSDGFPTYHLANVVDDYLMKITHVVRGAEWMSSTPKHLVMYQAFGWQPPKFAHVGLLMDQNHQKLSKRNLDIDISAFRDKMGILPETLTNYVALLGWSHGQKKDYMSLDDLIKNFTMKFTRGDTVVTFDKLWYLQKQHAAHYIELASQGDTSKLEILTKPVIALLKERSVEQSASHILSGRSLDDYVTELFGLGARGYTNSAEFVDQHQYFFESPTEDSLIKTTPNMTLRHVPSEMLRKSIDPKDVFENLQTLEQITEEDWTMNTVRRYLDNAIAWKSSQLCEAFNKDHETPDLEMTQKAIKKAWSVLIHNYIRWALLASMPGPSSPEALGLLGREESLRRIALANSVLAQQIPNK